MEPGPSLLFGALRDGVAAIGAGGELTPYPGPMAAMLAVLGGASGPVQSLAGLRLDPAAAAALQAGEAVPLQAEGRHWLARIAREGAAAALVVSETTADERVGIALAELARLRALAAAATTLVHDFGNHLNACLGLAAQVRAQVDDPGELAILRELTAGTQQGASLARTLARLLARGDGERALVTAARLVDEALAVAKKAVVQHGIRFECEVETPSPVVRTNVTEAVQALWHTLMALLERAPQRLAVAVASCRFATNGGRQRPGARVRIVAGGLPPDVGAELVYLVERGSGFLALAARAQLAAGLTTAAFVQRRLGGDLLAATDGDDVVVDCIWPAVP